MKQALFAQMRSHPRFDVNITAKYMVKKSGAESRSCRIVNLSASGAAVRIPENDALTKETFIILTITIPKTILHVNAEAEIVWRRNRFGVLACGLRFKNLLSELMIEKLTT